MVYYLTDYILSEITVTIGKVTFIFDECHNQMALDQSINRCYHLNNLINCASIMDNFRKSSDKLSPFMVYLSTSCQDGERLPALGVLASTLGVSISALREQLEIARFMGVVEVKPKAGIRRIPYEFKSTVITSLRYAIEVDSENFQAYADIRKHIEAAYWHEAVVRLHQDDIFQLSTLVNRAFEKLAKEPPQVPHNEHREFHMLIYNQLQNTFVRGFLEAYWDIYEAVGLDKILDVDYLVRVWQYHHAILDAIKSEDYDRGHQLLIDHTDLLAQRPKGISSQLFE